MQERDQYAAARRADGMSQRNRAAVDVDLLGIPAKFLADRQRLGGKGLVGFDQVQLVQRPARFVQTAAGGRYRRDAHDCRVDTSIGVGLDRRQHRQTEGLGLVCAHQQYRRGAVVEAGGIAGGNRAILLERRLEFGQRLGGRAGSRLLVGVEAQWLAFALRNLDGRDFVLEAPGLDGCDSLLLR